MVTYSRLKIERKPVRTPWGVTLPCVMDAALQRRTHGDDLNNEISPWHCAGACESKIQPCAAIPSPADMIVPVPCNKGVVIVLPKRDSSSLVTI